MELPVYKKLNEPTASTRRLVPRSGMVEECDGCVHPNWVYCYLPLPSPLPSGRQQDEW